MISIKGNQEMTYVPNKYVEENTFIGKEPEIIELPEYENIKHLLPKPVWEGHNDEIECYYRAWEIAFSNICNPTEGSGFVSPFIDTAFNGCLFMWDSSFILMFTKYASHIFNFQKTLDNFYALQHYDGFISREIQESDGTEKFTRFDPASTGPNILPWCEWEYYTANHDKERLEKVFPSLLAYHAWLKEFRTWRDGLYWSSGWGCGMDNMPRMEKGYHPCFSHGHMVWADVCFQQIMSCDILIKMGKILGREDDTAVLKEEYDYLLKTVNEKLWDEETAFYYDLWKTGEHNMVKSIGAYWGLIANAIPDERIAPFVAHLDNENEFKRPHRVPTLSADNSEYNTEGEYWKGSIWAPTNYMVLKGLEKYEYHKLAFEIAQNHLECVTKCFKETGTLWENYAPEKVERGNISKPEFVGWTGLVPISVMFEFVLGIKNDPVQNKIIWHVNQLEKHGIKDYPIGNGKKIDLVCDARSSKDEKPVITVSPDCPIEIEIIWDGGSFSI